MPRGPGACFNSQIVLTSGRAICDTVRLGLYKTINNTGNVVFSRGKVSPSETILDSDLMRDAN